ncbi:MAG TPA: hypothetical protein DEQ56_07655 [Bacteroidetes bacterium]|jgi:hypothetical protein|nr:hypothetical protein [Bacteroidota bacterium]
MATHTSSVDLSTGGGRTLSVQDVSLSDTLAISITAAAWAIARENCTYTSSDNVCTVSLLAPGPYRVIIQGFNTSFGTIKTHIISGEVS